jgi:hypothetical protein
MHSLDNSIQVMTEVLRELSGVFPFSYCASFIVAAGLRHVSVMEDRATRRASRFTSRQTTASYAEKLLILQMRRLPYRPDD